tara:strand:- start:384 stop:1205 length:822 start_codon:yes stop_codon:yes gene_type:complete
MKLNIMSLNIHESIKNTLKSWNDMKKVPNIIFHGSYGTGKKTLLFDFINDIYSNDNNKKKFYVLTANCAHGKGIKFIRDELKLFSKTNISKNNGIFKSVILLNADYLTHDAQSALRRCIELFSNTTRFFLVVENKFKLLKPILSRFCEIYVPNIKFNNEYINLNNYNNININNENKIKELKKLLQSKNINKLSFKEIIDLSNKLYNKAFNSMDIISYIEKSKLNHLSKQQKATLIFCYYNICKKIKNEKLLIIFMLYFLFIRYYDNLENITFI